MLPARRIAAPSLADVLRACLASVSGEENRLELPPTRRAVVLLVDGLGAAALRARAGHARTLASRLGRGDVIDAGFPTTTAVSLASLTTGTLAGQHGLVGYTAVDPGATPDEDRVVNALSGWAGVLDPARWQRMPTLFEEARARGIDAAVVGPERYRGSGFTAAVLRGGRYVGAATIEDRLRRAAELVREPGRGIAYLYIPELDMAAHAHGVASSAWTAALESVDAAVRSFEMSLPADVGLLVTADHGIVDIPPHRHVLIDAAPGLLDGIRFVAGEPRCLQLHLEPSLTPAARAAVLERWRGAESARAWVVSRDEAIASGWFGEVDEAVVPRIGDILVAARGEVAYYDSRTASAGSRAMVGQHGSLSPDELRVPLLRFGAFAR